MRAGVWSAAVLLLLAAATAALRSAQVEGVRNSRRLSNFDSRGSTSTEKIDDAQPTFRSRSYRRREETASPAPRDITRSKSRNRITESLTSNVVSEQSPTENGRNDRFDSRRTNRIRTRPLESQNSVTTFPSRDSSVNNKARQSNRRAQITTTTVSPLPPSSSVANDIRRDVSRRAQTTTTEASTILSSPTVDEFKSEITASTFDDFTRTVPKEEDITTVQFKRRSTTARSIEVETPTSAKPARTRGRVSTKSNIKLDDMASSGATNVLSISENNLTEERSSEDARKSRKLRYRTRLTETDTNLTGEGITTSNEIIKTSRKQQKQPESRTTTLAPSERKVQRNIERNSSKSAAVKSMRVVRRPLSRGNENGTALPKVKTSDEIGDDDNYPASFKALIQAKNASTQVSSPPSESLSVKATHTAINTNTKPSLPSNTSLESNNITRLRSKLNATENDVKNGDDKPSESTLDSPKLKSQEYKLRGSYSSRARTLKADNVKTTTTSSPNSVKSSYKFTRKLRTTTSSPAEIKSSEGPRKFKRFESGQSPQTASRPLYSRKKIGNNNNKPADAVTSDNNSNNLRTSVLNNSVKLPRTSYYSRLRNNIKTTTESVNDNINDPFKADKKKENTAEMPLIYTMLNKPTKTVAEEIKSDAKDEFLLAVSSKESQENNVENDLITNAEESENMPVINVFPTTQKYHANYKDQSLGNERQNNEYVVTAATPAIRNIQTRKYTRKIFKSKERVESSTVNPVSKSKERTLRKYSDTFSKTTEASTNGITSDPEKPKSRFSSKYRASNLDKTFYKPTVPTVTTTTEVGEEILLGPDMNAISFTQTRSALSSADLRLSESLEKPSHVMNVEASNHSPSVTVSIFDALAEILTSTPRIQISTTTDVPQQTFTDSVVKQTLNSVSSNNNVNSVSDLSSQGTSTSTESLTTITTVQNTDQTTPTVLNRLSVEESVSPSLNIEENTMSTNNPQTTLTPTPTTPISARRPFAIKVLYSDTERPTDVPMTSSEPTTNWSTTENTKMVYNTVSDLILSNNNLVSSELTSMLSNNIKDIIGNLDEESRSRLSVDMAKLLKTLIPRVVNKDPSLNDLDNVPNTTPYSLEDIRDTENIDINNVAINTNEKINIDSKNFLQNVQDMNVNIAQSTTDSPISDAIINNSVNSISDSVFSTVLPLSESEAKVADIVTTTQTSNTNSMPTLDLSSTTVTTTPTNQLPTNIEILDTATLSSLETSTANVDNISVDTVKSPTIDPTNAPLPVSLFTNLNIDDSNPSVRINDNNNLTSMNKLDNRFGTANFDNTDIDDPSQISRFQLWVLSKKARVLKMIEQLIREHNDEIANGPLTEVFNQSNNVTLSNRLTEIINTMDSTTLSNNPSIEITTDFVVTTPTSATSNIPSELSETVDFLNNRIKADIISPSTTIVNDNLSTAIPDSTEVDPVSDVTEVITTTITNEIVDILLRTNANFIDQTTVRGTTNTEEEKENIISTTETVDQVKADITTPNLNIETTTETSITTESILETTTQAGIETTTLTILNETKSNDEITVTSQMNVASQPIIPKKDYVIFGILPNNTVVRKDPNDNVLETLTEASPYIIYGVLPNNTVIRKFPNGTRVPRIMQKIDVLPISPWSLRNPYSPIHNNPAIVRPQSNPIRVSTNIVTSTDTNNETENRLTTDTVNNQQIMIPSSALNLKDSSSFGITTATIKPSAEKSTASHVLNLRTTTMLPSIHEILLNSLSSATKEEMVKSSMKSSTPEPRILTLDIDPETKQIRTEKPNDGQGNTVFKFIPIDEVTVPPQETNVFKIASTKAPLKTNSEKEVQIVTPITIAEITTPGIQTRLKNTDEPTTAQPTVGTPNGVTLADNNVQSIMTVVTTNPTIVQPTTDSTTSNLRITTFNTVENSNTVTVKNVITTSAPTTTRFIPEMLTTTNMFTTNFPSTTESAPVPNNSIFETTEMTKTTTVQSTQNAVKSADVQSNSNKNQENANLLLTLQSILSTNTKSSSSHEIDQMKMLQALLSGAKVNVQDKAKSPQTTTVRSIEDEIRQFEEDTKFLKALLKATGRNPTDFFPSIDDVKPTLALTTTVKPITTTMTTTTTPAPPLSTTTTAVQSTVSIDEDLKKIKEDTQLLQALLQATGQTVDTLNLPIISGITSNVRIASNPLTTSIESNPTTPMNIRPVYTTIQPTEKTTTQTESTQTSSTLTTLQEQQSTVKEDIGISTTYRPVQRRLTSTTPPEIFSTISARRAPSLVQFTTEQPSTSTFSVEEDLAFLNNLKTVLNTNNNDDPEADLANRVIALAVERSLNELQTGTQKTPAGNITPNVVNPIRTTTRPTTTTTRMTTTTEYIPPVSTQSTPSIEDDIKQFEEDTKLLQALLKATGQDPSKFNIPTLPSVNKPNKNNQAAVITSSQTTTKPFGVKIAVKDELKNVQDDTQLLQTLIKLKDAQETTTQRNKIAITGQSSDEALKKLIQKAKPTAMVSEATKSSVSLSTEFGNSNDALLAALLKEQGFGPTTASSLDEQVRLAALLNQVVVTPKARRTTTPPPPPPPPPAPRRPILDGLAWLWQQWRDTAPGTGGAGGAGSAGGATSSGGPRTSSRRPAPSHAPAPAPRPTAAATPAPSRANWFGSGPFVGNADDRPASNRIPLEPPRAVAAEQAPGRGQLVSAAINVTRAFSQFLGAAIQGAAQTVQNVIRAGQKAATDVYTNGSG
ncbi:PREDICTED: mucin-2-like isoform X2 [Papilio polytes]|uniref:mucin-2-like isoform X2 n=1 Tax=Papilio polytes TaxID=76194 RepID=UPI00067633AA|nr:PREDICTED: mucin-2-like isoform X2 [Papilio polytes]